MEIIGKACGTYVQQYQYARYRLDCGHERDLKKAHVKSGKFRCTECFMSRLHLEATAKHLQLIETVGDNYRRYKHTTCGHLAVYETSQVRNSVEVNCQTCYEDNLINRALEQGCSITEDVCKPSHRVLRYNECQHLQVVKTYDISDYKIPKCNKCKGDRLVSDAQKAGLELLGPSDILVANCRLYNYLLPCGCIKSFRAGNVRRNVFACDTHSNWLSKESSLYLFKIQVDDFVWLKLGVSITPLVRLLQYELPVGYSYELLVNNRHSSYSSALRTEKRIHGKFNLEKLNFVKMKNYMKSGYTECYPISMLDRLLLEIQEKDTDG